MIANLPFEKRWLKYMRKRKTKLDDQKALAQRGILLPLGAGLFYWLASSTYRFSGAYEIGDAFLVFAVLGAGRFCILKLTNFKKMEAEIAGPEPLRRKVDDFGPSAAASPVHHPAGDELGYRPAV